MREFIKFLMLVLLNKPCPLCQVNPAHCCECEMCGGAGIVPASFQAEI